MKKRLLAVLLAVSMLAAMLVIPAGATNTSDYTDVAESDWFYEAVDFVTTRDYFRGMSPTTFEPQTTMTRAMFATVIGRVEGLHGSDEEVAKQYPDGPFTDVPDDAWYRGYVNWCYDKGITRGTSATTFTPDKEITREEMASMMMRYVRWHEAEYGVSHVIVEEPYTYSDGDQVGADHVEDVADCYNCGLLQGYPDGTFGPKRTATRAEVAQVIARLAWMLKDMLYDAMSAGVADLNAHLSDSAVTTATDAAEKYGVPVTIDEVQIGANQKKEPIEVTTSASVALTDEAVKNVAVTAVYYAYKVMQMATDQQPAFTVDEVEEDIRTVLGELGVDIDSAGSARELAQMVYDRLKAEVKEQSSEVWAEFRVGATEENVYLFDSVSITGKDDAELFTIYTNNGAGTTIDGGKKAALKALAKDLAKQYHASLQENTERTSKVDLEAKLGIHFATPLAPRTTGSNPEYVLVMKLSLDSAGYLEYQYAGGVDNYYVMVPAAKAEGVIRDIAEVFAAEANNQLRDKLQEEFLNDNVAAATLQALQEEATPEYLAELFAAHGIDLYQELADRGIEVTESDEMTNYIFAVVADYMNEQAGMESQNFADQEVPDVIDRLKTMSLSRLANLATSDVVTDKLNGRGSAYLKRLARAMDLIPGSATVSIDGHVITAADLEGIQAAAATGDAVATVQAIESAVHNTVGDITLGQFLEGLKVEGTVRGYSYSFMFYLENAD